ncbi:MAG TPA: DUF4258 domain-containing protein [Chloroflexota bacterium]|nr:DUF4258 domain-containing protein [Chloroflexota bacterium]
MNIELIRRRILAGNYLIKSHAVQHALKEGFARKHMIEAIMNGQIIEEYPDDERMLVCGQTKLLDEITIYLHVVCEYADPVFVEFITAYIPDEHLWETPPYRRRKRLRR